MDMIWKAKKRMGRLLAAGLIIWLAVLFPDGGRACMDGVYAAAFENESTKGMASQNIHTQNYNGNWFHPVKSYLHRNADGTYNRVECVKDCLYSETYSAEYKYLSRKKVKLELERFGGLYITEDAYFVVEGQDNEKAKAGITEFRVIKYDKAWSKLASCDIKDANTCYPFDAGSCRFAEDNGILYVRTCHEMYNGHQASVMLQVNMSDCSIVTANFDVANNRYGYISHSFNEFVATANGILYACDHGDAFERGITVMRYDYLAPGTETFDNKAKAVVALPFAGNTGDNYTMATLGGFAVSASHAIAVGSSGPQEKTPRNSDVYNIFVATVATDHFSQDGSTVKWITGYPLKGKRSVTNPQMVEAGNDRYLVMWEEYVNDEFDRMCYVFLDGTGAVISKIYSIWAPLSECQPIVSGDHAVWYVTDGSSPVFYQLPLSGDSVPAAKTATEFTKNGTVYRITKGGTKSGKVSVTGYHKKKISSEVVIPNRVFYNGYAYSVTAIAPKAFRKCTKMKYLYLPDTVASIGKQAFEGCKKLEILHVAYKKYTTKNVGKNAFKGVPNVWVITPKKKATAYKKLFIKRGLKSGSYFTS